jgi:serine/threonine protein kinase
MLEFFFTMYKHNLSTTFFMSILFRRIGHMKDSGVGDSVACSGGASSSMVSLLAQEAAYRSRTLAPAFHDFVCLCLKRRPADRPSAATLLDSHPFVQPGFWSSSSSSSLRSRLSSNLGPPDDLFKILRSSVPIPDRVKLEPGE